MFLLPCLLTYLGKAKEEAKRQSLWPTFLVKSVSCFFFNFFLNVQFSRKSIWKKTYLHPGVG